MNNFLNYILAVFSIYRVSIMLAEQEGPFDIFVKIRLYFINNFKQLWVHSGVTCAECISFWLSLPIVFVNSRVSGWLLWLGTSGVIVMLLRSTKE